jgi:hypothetical protein
MQATTDGNGAITGVTVVPEESEGKAENNLGTSPAVAEGELEVTGEDSGRYGIETVK